MPAVTVGTRPNEDYVVMNGKLDASMGMGVMTGKGASKDKPRVAIRSAEAGTPSPGTGTMLDMLEV